MFCGWLAIASIRFAAEAHQLVCFKQTVWNQKFGLRMKKRGVSIEKRSFLKAEKEHRLSEWHNWTALDVLDIRWTPERWTYECWL